MYVFALVCSTTIIIVCVCVSDTMHEIRMNRSFICDYSLLLASSCEFYYKGKEKAVNQREIVVCVCVCVCLSS